MEQQLNLLLWVISGGFGVTFALLVFLWNSLNSRIDRLENRIDRLEQRFERLEGRMTLLEHDMVEVKTILRMKECCMIKDDSQVKKAE